MPVDGALSYFTDHMYGRMPDAAVDIVVAWQQLEEGPSPYGGRRRQLRLDISAPTGPATTLTLLVHLPSAAGPVPAFVGLNFRGNHTCTDDPAVLDLTEPGTDPEPRGSQARLWDLGAVVARGYASITLGCLQVGPDSAAMFATGPHRTLGGRRYEDRLDTDWGALGIWAWTLSRVLDGLAAGMVPEIDPQRVVVHGHSRLGKSALWAGATDPRWAAVISNNSGGGGAALSRDVGQTPQDLARRFAHWFAPSYAATAAAWQRIHDGAPQDIPDQPDLLASIAPRPLYVCSASEDAWADPEGEFLSWQQASGTWPGGAEATVGEFPTPNTIIAPTTVPLGYHLRDGGHDVTPYDWAAWLDFADRWVR